MIVTKKYCDLCGKEVDRLFDMDLERPLHFGSDWTAPFGKYTLDGVWEAELCMDCMAKVISKVREMKE